MKGGEEMERLPNEVLDNAIHTMETTAKACEEESTFDKCVLLFLKELKEYRNSATLPELKEDGAVRRKVTERILLPHKDFNKLVNADRVVFEHSKDCVMYYLEDDTAEKKDGWIPAEKLKPKYETKVFILTDKGTKTTAIYEDGTMPVEDSIWFWDDAMDFIYDEDRDLYLVPEGWWEYRHFNPDEVYNNKIDEKVISWRPMSE